MFETERKSEIKQWRKTKTCCYLKKAGTRKEWDMKLLKAKIASSNIRKGRERSLYLSEESTSIFFPPLLFLALMALNVVNIIVEKFAGERYMKNSTKLIFLLVAAFRATKRAQQYRSTLKVTDLLYSFTWYKRWESKERIEGF